MTVKTVKKKERGLTPKQKRFVQEYLIDLNATQAAIRAGYSKKTANAAAGRLLANVSIQESIQKGCDKRAKRTSIEQDRVLYELAQLAFSNIADFVDVKNNKVKYRNWHDLDDDKTRCVESVKETATPNGKTISIKLCNKQAALDSLARHLGMFRDQLEVKGGLSISDLWAVAKRGISGLKDGERK